MGNILIKALPVASHYNATFKLAKQLQRKGHSIVYLGDDNFRETVLANGFEYHICDSNYGVVRGFNQSLLHSLMNKYQHPYLKSLSFLMLKFKQYIYFLRRFGNDSLIKESENIHRKIISKFNPDLVILDIFYDFQIPLFYNTKTKLLIYQTKFPTNKDPGIPPLCSSYVPSCHKMSDSLISLLWEKYFFIKYLGDIKRRLKLLSNDRAYIFKKYANRVGYPIKQFREKRAFHHGYCNYYELILSPEELNYNRTIRSNQVNIGPVIDLNREETGYNYTFFHDKKNLKVLTELNTIVYCSLGSLPHANRNASKVFFKNVIELFEELPNHILILSLGGVEMAQFEVNSPNVYIYNKVPQIEVLKIADIMITHGGMQSITESILNKVPMLVYPLNKLYDQKGNAARIKYHGLGIVGNIKRDSKKIIKKKLQTLTRDTSYKKNVEIMMKKIQQSSNFKNGIEFINNYINMQ